MYVCAYVCTVCMSVCTYVHMYVCVFMYVCVCILFNYCLVSLLICVSVLVHTSDTHMYMLCVYIYIYIFSYLEADTFSIVVLKAQCSQFHSKPKHLRFQEVVRSRAQAQTCHGIATASSTAVPRHHSKPSVSAGESNQSLVRRCELGIQEAGQPGHC